MSCGSTPEGISQRKINEGGVQAKTIKLNYVSKIFILTFDERIEQAKVMEIPLTLTLEKAQLTDKVE